MVAPAITTTASSKESFGLPVIISDPLWFSSPLIRDELTIDIREEGYTHELDAVGGYKSASFSFPTTKLKAEEWFSNGLGRDVTVYNPGGQVRFNGFVNQVDVSIGVLTGEQRGPLLSVGNRASSIYTILDNSVFPPVKGSREVTTIVDDTDSQARYGIIEKVVSAGTVTTEDAERVRDTFLEENKDPETSGDIVIPGEGSPVVSLVVLGYIEWFKVYIYNNNNTGTISISDKIMAVIGNDPNNIFSTDLTKIEPNAYLTTESEINDSFGWAIIKGLISLGDATDARYILGVYQDRVVRYNAIPTTIEYLLELLDGRQSVSLDVDGTIVDPWDILPGRWIQLSDWLVGRTQETTDLRKDSRNKFIESVRYSAPDQVQLVGRKVDKVPQIIAKLGLSGGS